MGNGQKNTMSMDTKRLEQKEQRKRKGKKGEDAKAREGDATYVNPSHSNSRPSGQQAPSSSNASGFFFVTLVPVYSTSVQVIGHEEQQKEAGSSGCAFYGQHKPWARGMQSMFLCIRGTE